jgi:Fis family transcriptional regulator
VIALNKKTTSKKSLSATTRKPLFKPHYTPTTTMPLRAQTAAALEAYFSHLNGDRPAHLYELVLREVEEPLFRAVMTYVEGNQSRAAEVLGINRGTLRKKLREYRLSEAN